MRITDLQIFIHSGTNHFTYFRDLERSIRRWKYDDIHRKEPSFCKRFRSLCLTIFKIVSWKDSAIRYHIHLWGHGPTLLEAFLDYHSSTHHVFLKGGVSQQSRLIPLEPPGVSTSPFHPIPTSGLHRR